MVYLMAKPSAALDGFVRGLWYASVSDPPHHHERVLPNGTTELVINLAADSLTDCGLNGGNCLPMPPAILVGPRGDYKMIHTRDMKELVGVSFRPGGLGVWLKQPASDFFKKSVCLESICRLPNLRDRLCQATGPPQKLETLDRLLVKSLGGRSVERKPALRYALSYLRDCSVQQTAGHLGLSERRLRQLFQEDAGLSPKLWSRLYRFQRTLKSLHSGTNVAWEQLALECGYFDQSHFINDFRSFSGISPSIYSSSHRPWQNHLAVP